MILCFQVLATFGISAVLSFVVSAAVLLAVAAKSGVLRARSTPKGGRVLLPPSAPLLAPSAPPLTPTELMPLKTDSRH